MTEPRAPVGSPYALPPDLPVPRDDGAAAGLEGRTVPALRCQATSGPAVDLADAAAGTLVLYLYPATGVPDQPLPAGWDQIPGARGCTAENCAFRDHARDLRALGAVVYGLSAQPLEEQAAFAERERLPYPLLNDSALRLEQELGLPTFEVAGRRFYRRLTLVAREGRIEKVFYPVFPPDRHPAEVVAWLTATAER
jgi:peroxiredoxin